MSTGASDIMALQVTSLEMQLVNTKEGDPAALLLSLPVNATERCYVLFAEPEKLDQFIHRLGEYRTMIWKPD